jgi:hypothetical protein
VNAEHRKPRKSSDARGGFPYSDPRVPFILIGSDEISIEGDGMNWAFALEEKLALVEVAEQDPEVVILACWPGKTRTDVFALDDLAEARERLEAA